MNNERNITSKQLAGYAGVSHEEIEGIIWKVAGATRFYKRDEEMMDIQFLRDEEAGEYRMNTLECMMVASEIKMSARVKVFAVFAAEANQRCMVEHCKERESWNPFEHVRVAVPYPMGEEEKIIMDDEDEGYSTLEKTPEECTSKWAQQIMNGARKQRGSSQSKKGEESEGERGAGILIGDAAKILGWGEGRLFKWLRVNGYLSHDREVDGSYRNVPQQKYIDKGYFKVKQQKYWRLNEQRISITPLMTERGLRYFEKKLEEAQSQGGSPENGGTEDTAVTTA